MHPQRTKTPNTACSECGTPIYRLPMILARWAHHYCSETCQKAAQQRQRAERHAAGLCARPGCPNLSEPNRTCCAEHLAAQCTSGSALKKRRKDKGVCTMCGRPRGDVRSLTCQSCKDKQKTETHKAHVRTYRQRLKDQAYAAYGGYICACCGETEPLFLTLDHIANDGGEHRRKLVKPWKRFAWSNNSFSNNSLRLYQWVEKNSYPPGFQVLCWNCNMGKYRNGGTCPHIQRQL